MVQDHHDNSTPSLQLNATRLRFIPLQILGSYNIPHAVWNDDASICHEVPSLVWNVMEILVPKAKLQKAAERLVGCLSAYTRRPFPPEGNSEGPIHQYSEDCILLASCQNLSVTADYIILVPDELFYFDTTDPLSLQGIPDFLKSSVGFDKARVPSFSALINALLRFLDESKCRIPTGFNTEILTQLRNDIQLRVVMLVAWRRKEQWVERYNSPEEYPATLKEVRNCLLVENLLTFDSIYTHPRLVSNPTHAPNVSDSLGKLSI
ncbi:hypothetical protein TWF506_009294 [Arthrobotrys conoides]|uniref:Uncharacterized protein n=1 Tax=Arthrobotrys conoides TaxID=74498 RepID=A0AAN8NNB0_9PEZI